MTLIRLSTALLSSALCATALSAQGQQLIQNGDFETGTTANWTVVDAWTLNDGSLPIPGNGLLATPLGGSFDMLTTGGGPGLRILSQDVVLPATINSAILQWTDEIRNFASMFADPNQEFRVLLIDAAGNSTEVFSTNPGDMLIQPPTPRIFDVTSTLQPLAGQTVTLAFEQEDNLFFFNMSLDDIRLTVNQPNAVPASFTANGQGCPNGGMFYELFPGGTEDVANSSWELTPIPQGYNVTQGTGTFEAPVTSVPSGDDQVLGPFNLPFSFGYSGGTTMSVEVSSNGYVYLQAGTITGSRCCAGNVPDFSSEAASIAVFGTDLNPSAGGQVFVDQFTGPDRFVVTWQGVPQFGQSNAIDAQVQLYADGRIVFVYGNVIGSGNDTLIGFSAGNGAGDPGSVDLTGITSQVAPTLSAVQLSAAPGSRPLVGTMFQAEVSSIPSAGIIGALLLGQFNPMLDLTPIGMETCTLFTSGEFTIPFPVSGPTATVNINVPNTMAALGVTLETQAAIIAPGANTFGVIASNGGTIVTGNL